MGTWWNYLYIFLQSNLIEVIFLCLYFASSKDKRGGVLRIALAVTLCNSITHPVVIFGWMKGPWNYLTAILLAEGFAIFAETLLYQWFFGFSWRRAFAGSLIANILSWQLGPILTALVFF